ncbi:MAG TPA: IS1634 family transposase [Clostridia bacterium]|nr:IS1634 family transposase [Clostridia bacterium]
MRLKISKSKNAASFYVIKSIYNPKTQKNTSVVVEKLGTEVSLREKLDGQDPYEWAKEYVAELNRKEKEDNRQVLVKRRQSKRIPKDKQQSFNGGYLFLQDIYHQLNINTICKEISSKYKFTYDLDSIVSRLLYGRILFPSSKLNTFQLSKTLLEEFHFELQHIYRGLDVIAKESDFIQASLYKNSLEVSKRNDKVLYYDCTNYFFEIEQEDGLKQYGPSKEHRPNPIVEMGLFMDGDGIPLAFSIHSGNINEQQTLQPLEKQIMKDFSLSKFVVCTDAGLSSNANRKFNNRQNRAFITTQSLKKLKAHLKEWALSPEDWRLSGTDHTFNLETIESSDELRAYYKNSTFYKERWINENGLEQRLIVTFSLKFQCYQRNIRNRQINRAENLIEKAPSTLKKHRQTDYKRFVEQTNITDDGEVAEGKVYGLNEDKIRTEELFDGFYGVCTNLEDEVEAIIKINHRRWEIEENFRLLKTDFKARPIYLSRDNRIKAHFTTCFLALVLYRYLEKQLKEMFTSTEIISQLRDMNFYHIPGEGYIPTYTRTNFTDALHESFGFNTDFEIVSTKNMKKIFKETKYTKKVRKK